MNSRARARTSLSIGSNQLSKRSTAISAAGCQESGFVVSLIMAWSPVRRFNAGRFEVDHPGDYATINSYQLPYGTNFTELNIASLACGLVGARRAGQGNVGRWSR